MAAEELSGLYQCRELVLRESRRQLPGLYTVGCFEEHALPKASQQPGQPEEISLEGSRYVRGGGACCDSIGAEVSQGLR